MIDLVELAKGILETDARLKAAEHRVAHLERIIRQAVLSNGGLVKVDPAQHQAALDSTADIWFGGDGVSLVEA